MNKTMMTAAMVAGMGAVCAAGVLGMQRMKNGSPRRVVATQRRSMNSMAGRMAHMGNEFADEFCAMAHKTGNAMIRTGRFINKMVP